MGQEPGREGNPPVLSYRAESQPRLRSCGEEGAYGAGWVCPERNRGQKALRCRSRACRQGIAPGRARRIAGAAPREGGGEPSPARLAPGGASWGPGGRAAGTVTAPPVPGLQQSLPLPREQPEGGPRRKSLISPNFSGRSGRRGGCPRCGSAMLVCKRGSCPISFPFFFFLLPFPPL